MGFALERVPAGVRFGDVLRAERIREAGTYLGYSSDIRQREPLKYVSSFHTTNFYPFYDDCLAWFDTY